MHMHMHMYMHMYLHNALKKSWNETLSQPPWLLTSFHYFWKWILFMELMLLRFFVCEIFIYCTVTSTLRIWTRNIYIKRIAETVSTRREARWLVSIKFIPLNTCSYSKELTASVANVTFICFVFLYFFSPDYTHSPNSFTYSLVNLALSKHWNSLC